MPASPTHTETATSTIPPSVMPEAEALCSLLGDLGLVLAVNLETDGIFATCAENPKAGALDVLNVITQRAVNDDQFRDDLISAIGVYGYYLDDAPGVNVDFKTAPANALVQALASVGLLLRHHYERGDGRTPMISFIPVPDHPIGSNAHLLMKLVVDRFTNEPDFAADLTQFVIAAGQSQHDA